MKLDLEPCQDAPAAPLPRPDHRGLLIALAVIGLPFLAMVFALHGLHTHIYTFFGDDEEKYHLPTIARFAASFPRLDLRDYHAAMTPGYHVVFATISALLHPSLPQLRGINVVIGYGATVAALALFRREFRFAWPEAVLAALAWGLGPYVFGPSFLVLTDNTAFLLSWCALLAVLEHRRGGSMAALVAAVVLAAMAILVRQTCIWLLPVILLLGAGGPDVGMDRRVALLLLCGLAVAPLALLVVLWGGFNPPSFQKHAGLNPRNVTFMLASLGFYAAPLLALNRWKRSDLRRRDLVVAAAVAVLVAAALLAWPLAFVAPTPGDDPAVFRTNGYLWKYTQWAPRLMGSNLILVALALVGAATLLLSWKKAGPMALAPMVALLFPIASLASRPLYGKYFDPMAMIVALIVLAEAADLGRWRARLLIGAYIAFAMAYLALDSFLPHGASLHVG